MKIKFAITLILTLGLTGCGDSADRAIGLYKYKHFFKGEERIAEVKKDGDTYLFVEDVIRNSNVIALSKTDDGLSYNNMPLKLSEDGNTLYFGQLNAVRVDRDYLSELLAINERNNNDRPAPPRSSGNTSADYHKQSEGSENK